MAVPTSSSYPDDLDTNDNLYQVFDSLRLRLAEDYAPGDSSITIDAVLDNDFPLTGQITLTDQCSDLDERAVSLHYASRTDTTFDELSLLGDSGDFPKSKKITNVTLNVMSDHHNNLKDALIAIEEFVGIKGTVDATPFGSTMEGRINFLHKLALKPRAWFTSDKRIGIVPLTVEFTDLTFRTNVGCPVGPVSYFWYFGDHTSMVSVIPVISVTDIVPVTEVDVIVEDLDGGSVLKTYNEPGIYSVSLEVVDKFGSDMVVFPSLINARIAAPNEATISIVPRSSQSFIDDALRTPTNTLISILVPQGVEPGSDPPRTYAGELVDGSGEPIDPIVDYTWALGDDLTHEPVSGTNASYGIGGLYDINLRTDTQYGAYRITVEEDKLDVIESQNLWLWTAPNSASPNDVQAYEFGLISQTFKVGSYQTLSLSRDDSFLDGTNNETQAKREFKRNNGFASRQTFGSGNKASSTLLFWASGRTALESPSDEDILAIAYNGFFDTYSSATSISRPWNWAAWSAPSSAYFLLGNVTGVIPDDTSPTDQDRMALNLASLTTSTATFATTDYSNGADELEDNVATYNEGTVPDDGYFAVFRTAWQNNNGYLVRNSGVGDFFRLLSFYVTDGTFAEPFTGMSKLSDMLGTAKTEGQLVPLSQGVYFFNNSGSVSAYNTATDTWATNTTENPAGFRALQDMTVPGYADESNTLVAASDGNRIAYLSYDYSADTFIKYNEVDKTFSTLGSRPAGEQWLMGVY